MTPIDTNGRPPVAAVVVQAATNPSWTYICVNRRHPRVNTAASLADMEEAISAGAIDPIRPATRE